MNSLLGASDRLIWINNNSKIPDTAKALVNLATTPSQLRDAVATVSKGDTWGIEDKVHDKQQLSHREQEVITLLASGLRDRDIANQLYISDSTVKFHVNNILIKLEAKTRLQALYKLISSNGWEFQSIPAFYANRIAIESKSIWSKTGNKTKNYNWQNCEV